MGAMRCAGAALLTVTLVAALAGCSSLSDPSPPSGVDMLEIPTPSPDPDDFVDRIDHPWLPLEPGAMWVYEGRRTLTVEVQDRTFPIEGVETTAVEGRLVASLRAIPRPPDRAKVDEAVGRLAEQHAKDELVGRRLQTRYDESLLRKAVQDYEREATRLRTLFRQLGAAGCVSYFNPSSYG